MGVIFANINVREHPKSLLKIKEVFRDKSIRFKDADSKNYGFRPNL